MLRDVILTVDNLEEEGPLRDMQFYVGADDDRAFTKRLAVRGRVPHYEVGSFIYPGAYQAAEMLTEDDLDTLYYERRYSSPDQA
jgi:hypothetical protein